MQQIHCNYLYFIRAKSQRRNILETAALSCSSCYQWSWITVNTFKYIHLKKKKIEWTVFILFFLNVFIFTQVPYKLKQCYSWLTAQSPGDSNIIIWALVDAQSRIKTTLNIQQRTRRHSGIQNVFSSAQPTLLSLLTHYLWLLKLLSKCNRVAARLTDTL